jgi:signal transduction histidine kinase
MRSVQARLGSGIFVALTIVFVVLGVGLSFGIGSVVESHMETRLDHDAESLLSALRFTAGNGIRLRARRANPIFMRVYSGHYFRIMVGSRTLRSRSLWQHDLDIPRLDAGQSLTLRRSGPNGEPLLVRAHGYRKHDREVTIAVAEDLSPVQSGIRRWQLGFAGVTIVALLAALGVQAWLLRRSFRPLTKVREEVQALGNGERRTLSEAVPSEVLPLVQAVNRFLQLLDERLQRSRKSAGNLAHALKAPLSVLGHIKDDPALKSHPALSEQMGRQLASIHGQVQRELNRARLTGSGAPGATFNPKADLSDLVRALEAMHRERNVTIVADVPEHVAYRADREDMLELLGNLLDNACKWAKSKVQLVLQENDGLYLTVEDDGVGVSETELSRLQGRGERLDEFVAGHGLGLAIVHDVVACYRGRLAFDRSPDLGGLRVEVSLLGPSKEQDQRVDPAA